MNKPLQLLVEQFGSTRTLERQSPPASTARADDAARVDDDVPQRWHAYQVQRKAAREVKAEGTLQRWIGKVATHR